MADIQNSYLDFPYKSLFSSLTEDEYELAKEFVESMWSGVFQMWGACSAVIRDKKRQLAMSLLIAWYIADMYPTRLLQGTSDGGRPLSSKAIQQTAVAFRKLNLPDAYDPLSTNQFGVKAALMIHNAPDMMGIYGGSM
jgi:hypothetical protein